jgi:hypothetical protein
VKHWIIGAGVLIWSLGALAATYWRGRIDGFKHGYMLGRLHEKAGTPFGGWRAVRIPADQTRRPGRGRS